MVGQVAVVPMVAEGCSVLVIARVSLLPCAFYYFLPLQVIARFGMRHSTIDTDPDSSNLIPVLSAVPTFHPFSMAVCFQFSHWLCLDQTKVDLEARWALCRALSSKSWHRGVAKALLTAFQAEGCAQHEEFNIFIELHSTVFGCTGWQYCPSNGGICVFFLCRSCFLF